MVLGFGMPGVGEWVIILVIVVIFFGVGRLPDVLGQMGKGVKAFKDGMNSEGKPGNRAIDVDDAVEVKPSADRAATPEQRQP